MRIAITGTPGTGKSAVAVALGRLLGWDVLDLNRLADKQQLYSGNDRERGVPIVDIDKVTRAADKLSGDLIVESHYAHDLPCDQIVVLRCNPGMLKKRLKEKGWPQKKIDENVQAEIMEVCLDEAREHGPVLEIDTTHTTPEEAAAQVRSGLRL